MRGCKPDHDDEHYGHQQFDNLAPEYHPYILFGILLAHVFPQQNEEKLIDRESHQKTGMPASCRMVAEPKPLGQSPIDDHGEKPAPYKAVGCSLSGGCLLLRHLQTFRYGSKVDAGRDDVVIDLHIAGLDGQQLFLAALFVADVAFHEGRNNRVVILEHNETSFGTGQFDEFD